jgi:16S rRNA (guanine966-N2)-methyltransferase
MRLIGGSAAGTILKVPKGFEVRPTPDLVRQAIFNSLGPRVADAAVLEVFAGTGALSLECLSRGAARAVCVEKSGRHARFIRQNLALARLPEAALEIRIQDAFAALAQLAAANCQFDLLLADPPYGEKNVNRRSTSLAQQLFILGHTKRDTLDLPPPWHESKRLKHGDSVIRFLQLIPR